MGYQKFSGNKIKLLGYLSIILIVFLVVLFISSLFCPITHPVSFFDLIKLSSQDELDPESIYQSINFIGIILALLFTLIVLPLQHILGKYSQELVDRVLYDHTFTFTLYFFVSVFIFDLFSIVIFPAIEKSYWAYIILNINFIIIILSLLTLIFFIKRVFKLLDLRNHFREIKNDSINIIPLIIDHPDFCEKLINYTEIIFDSIQKSISENRFEIIISGLENILEIVLSFIEIFKPKEKSKFVSFVINSLNDTKDMITENNNPKIVQKIIYFSMEIGKKLFTLDNPDSGSISKIINLTTSIILSKNMVKNTSDVQINGIDGLCSLGKESIRTENNIILRHISNSLGRVGRSSYSNDLKFRLRTHSNEKLSELLFFSFDNLNKIDKHNLEKIIQEIDQNIVSSITEQFGDLYVKDIQTFINESKKYSLANFFIKLIENTDSYNLEFMDVIIKNFRKYFDLCVESEQLHAYFAMEYILYSNYKTMLINISIISESKFQKELIDILEYQLNIFLKITDYSLKNSGLVHLFYKFMSLLPISLSLILIYNNNGIFDKLISKFVLNVFNLIEERLKEYKIIRNMMAHNYENISQINEEKEALSKFLVEIYPYLRLIGRLLFKNYSKENFMNTIMDVLSKYEKNGLIELADIYPTHWATPVFDDIKDENLQKNLQKSNNLNFSEFNKFDSYLRNYTDEHFNK
jgi:hypothetical protein